MIRTIRMDDSGAREALTELRRPLLLEQLLQDSPELQSVRAIIDDVRARGDAAVADATQRVDNVVLAPGSFRVPPEELTAARTELDPALRAAVRKAIDQVRAFQEHILTQTREPLRRPKVALQARLRPMRRVCSPRSIRPPSRGPSRTRRSPSAGRISSS